MIKKLVGLLLKIIIGFVIITVIWVLSYRIINPPISGMMFYKYLSINDYNYSFDWIDLVKVSPNVPLAFIAAEDQLFLTHSGFDIEAIEDAIEHNKTHNNVRGASTISQQVAKNVFLIPTKNFIRKGFEVYFTILIELLWDKKRIMEVYINIVELGDQSFGIRAASEDYFNKLPKLISKSQAALIATVLPNPIVFNLRKPTPYMRERQAWILKQMNNLGGTSILDHWYE